MLYMLDNKTPVKVENADTAEGMMQWSMWYKDIENRRVVETQVGDTLVSTVFLGVDTGGADSQGRPFLFETMTFVEGGDNIARRSCTWEDAEIIHKQAVESVTTNSVTD